VIDLAGKFICLGCSAQCEYHYGFGSNEEKNTEIINHMRTCKNKKSNLDTAGKPVKKEDD
jgi:hypothetical protein